MPGTDRRQRHPARLRLALSLAVGVATASLGGCASIVIHERPVLDRSARDRGPVPPGGASPGDAESLLQRGMEQDRRHPGLAIVSFRDAALAALPRVAEEGVSTRIDIAAARGAQGTYRRAIEYALEAAHREAAAEGLRWTEVLARAGIGVQGRISLYDATRCDDVLPTRRYEVTGFRHEVGAGGVGAPVVAHVTRAGTWGQNSAVAEQVARAARLGEPDPEVKAVFAAPCERHFPKSLFYAGSAILRPGGAGEPPAVLEIRDPVRECTPAWRIDPGGPDLPLAYDMTIPLAKQFHVNNLNLLGALGVLYPSQYNGNTGIYMVDPYEPGKIPVVLVHGLMSSPEAWDNAMNELRGDPELRARYQFWLFFYSTGNPILASGARFRKALNELRDELDPTRRDPAFDRMVLIGHSMGGLLSRLAISRSGQQLWDTASKVPPDAVKVEPGLKELLVSSLIFEPVPAVRRVIFVATPHKGSPLGDEPIGRIASRLITVPSDVIQVRRALLESNGGDVAAEFRGNRYATSVAQLSIGNPVIKAINSIPMSEAVAYHSIVGFDGKTPLPAGGDGVVPYLSAHLDGAMSELIVSSGHSSQETEDAIREMRRILVQHLEEYDAERSALAAGERPTPAPTRPGGSTPVRRALGDPSMRDPSTRVITGGKGGVPLDLRIIR
ncbi:Alpha/beta hydrolase family protein [Aquisphaera giovannonii]|uniref:Alpha/beta hydrolase family protein n=1 Tax=Aquisphaera giovannonii TaxID=406548 RepID=A0A5B9VWR7_9BACT|nr:alpha/beta fold hydrolase [Aquisphaera giovannonii]QEH32150.1 Alpha/beta hydrolase family protein [Aquisphaera giovannonii]